MKLGTFEMRLMGRVPSAGALAVPAGVVYQKFPKGGELQAGEGQPAAETGDRYRRRGR